MHCPFTFSFPLPFVNEAKTYPKVVFFALVICSLNNTYHKEAMIMGPSIGLALDQRTCGLVESTHVNLGWIRRNNER